MNPKTVYFAGCTATDDNVEVWVFTARLGHHVLDSYLGRAFAKRCYRDRTIDVISKEDPRYVANRKVWDRYLSGLWNGPVPVEGVFPS